MRPDAAITRLRHAVPRIDCIDRMPYVRHCPRRFFRSFRYDDNVRCHGNGPRILAPRPEIEC